VFPGDHELSGAQHDVHSGRVGGYPGKCTGLPGSQLAEQQFGLAPQMLKSQGGQAVQRSPWTTFLAARRSASDRAQEVAVSRLDFIRGGRIARSADQTRPRAAFRKYYNA
jgi:hypothetical protein